MLDLDTAIGVGGVVGVELEETEGLLRGREVNAAAEKGAN
jgi:hypothetical protein